MRRSKNDSIFERLDVTFTLQQATQQTLAIKPSATTNSVHMMLKNWTKQGLIAKTPLGEYVKQSEYVCGQ